MGRDIRADELKKKLLQIEKNIENENGRIKINRIPAKYFMYFFVIGGEDEYCYILERKVKELLSNPDACEFMQISQKKPDGEYGKEADDILRRASENHVDVQGLNTIFLCPVIFSDNNIGEDLVTVLKEIDTYMKRSGHTSIWQPTLVIDKNINEYKNIYSSVRNIEKFICEMDDTAVNRCCLLSDIDEHGFKVPKENIMQTVAMTVVLQNVDSLGGDTQRIRSMVTRAANSVQKDKLFFTARNAAVTNPSRSLLLQRMSSAMAYFTEKNDSNQGIPLINYSFVSQIVRPYIEKLPRYAGKVTLFPLFSFMNDSTLHNRLERMVNEKYYLPIYGEAVRKIQIESARNKFLECYFAQNGSLTGLKKLIKENGLISEFTKHKVDCYSDNFQLDGPTGDTAKLAQYNGGESLRAAQYCSDFIKNAGWNLLETTGRVLTSKETEKAIEEVELYMETIKSGISTRIRQLKDVETVLVVEQTAQRTDFDDIQSDWFKNEVLNNPSKYAGINKSFNEEIYSMLCSENVDIDKVLNVCYEAVKDSTYSNSEYMERVSDECSKNDAVTNEFITTVEKSWCYTLRFINLDTTADATCIIGDSKKNYFCRCLQNKFQGSLFEFSGFDRIDVLHISGAFNPENVLEWEQIERVGKGES